MISNGLENIHPKKVVILGSTGSIGRQTLDVIAAYPDRFSVIGLAAHHNTKELIEQARRFNCAHLALANENQYAELKTELLPGMNAAVGREGICELAALPDADLVVSAISGAAGILPTIAALQSGHPIALANKEALVAAGDLVMKLALDKQLSVFPVDSEHSAVFQCLKGEEHQIKKIWLTASGGPFLGYTRAELERVTPQMALKHPSWEMGAKISVDSATLINKGLEVIEAHHLFNLGYDYIDAIISPGSLVHALVEMKDGAFLAHLGRPDMRIPIQYALTYPERWPSPVQPLSLAEAGTISFKKPDIDAFPGFSIAISAGLVGGTMPAVMNAANEVAVAHFLNGKISFNYIPEIITRVMDRHQSQNDPNLDTILQADAWAREVCCSLIEGK
ncbi:MAG: 1-deoxy-D-xylulose-5-phosphate reductoisomerase [Methylocystaceae bacterium]